MNWCNSAHPTERWSFADLNVFIDCSHKIVRDFFYDDSILADLGSSESGDDDDDDAHSESDESDHDLSEDANDSTENTGQTGNDENTNASTLLQLLAGNAPTTQVVLIDENVNETFAQFIAMPIAGLGQDSEESDQVVSDQEEGV